jgi:hypothetical protein
LEYVGRIPVIVAPLWFSGGRTMSVIAGNSEVNALREVFAPP